MDVAQPTPHDYPAHWQVDAVLSDGGAVHIRPIRPDDAMADRAFFSKLSPQSVYRRFFTPKRELSDAEVEHFTTVDYDDRMAFVAVLRDEIIAVGRYDRLATTDRAEVAFVVADEDQGRGVGSLLLEYLASYARDKGITAFAADTLSENRRMLDVFRSSGFTRESLSTEQGVTRVTFDIEPTGTTMEAIHQREWRAGVRSIERLMRPRSIAVFGAGRAPQNIGHSVVRNLIAGGFSGPVYPINPNASAIDSVRAYPTLDDVPGVVDVAVVAVPADRALEVVDQCSRKGVGALVVISSGFAEVGEAGAALQRELTLRAHRGGMRMVGPNCFGIINTSPEVRLDATFASRVPVPGTIAFASQSGALGIAILEQSVAAGLGLSSFVSMGNKADVSSNDLLRYWSQDGETRAILLYLESFGNVRAFARIAPVVSRTTPIVVVKSGRSTAGRRAAASHTAAMASPDAAVDALFRQAGVIRVDTLEELLDCGALLAHQPALNGRRLAIIGNAGGAAVLATDACAAVDLEVPEFDAATQQALRALAGPNAGVSNPVDLGAGATADKFARAVEVALESSMADGVVVILAPVATVTSNDVARAVSEITTGTRPVVFVHLGSEDVLEALSAGERPIPCYAFPERAVRALGRIAEHSAWRARPGGEIAMFTDVDLVRARGVVKGFLREAPNGGWLPAGATAELLRAFGVPLVDQAEVHSAEDAVTVARQLGLPVVLKVVATEIQHKTDVGGVRLGLSSAAEVRSAYVDFMNIFGDTMRGAILQPMVHGIETIAGVVSDPDFGPLVMFGSGGTAAELMGDRALRILPLTVQDAAEQVRSIRSAQLLFGYRGSPKCDVAAIEEVLLRISLLADEIPQLAEMDLNPLMATPRGALVVDSRIRVVPWRRHAEREVRRLR